MFRRLHARLHANRVIHPPVQHAVDFDEVVNRTHRFGWQFGQQRRQERPGRLLAQIRRKIGRELRFVGEREFFRLWRQEEIERVVDRHLGHKIDRDLEFARGRREHQPRLVVRKRILLPIEEMLLGRDPQRIGKDSRAAVRGRAQPDDLRPETDSFVVTVGGYVMECDMDAHSLSPSNKHANLPAL